MLEEPTIRILPRGNPATGSLILSFCYSPNCVDIPKIRQVRIGPDYPFLFSLAVRTNPFDPGAQVEIP